MIGLVVFPVFATDSFGNEIIKMSDYVEYSFPEDTSAGDVYADCYFPDRWFSTEVSGENWSGGIGTFYGRTFTYEPSQDVQSYRIRPVGGNVQNGEIVGDQIKYAHIIDLTAVPSKSWFHSSFQIKVNLPYGDGNVWQQPTTYAYLFFVDSSGKIVHKWYDKIQAQHYTEGDGGSGVIQAWSYSLLTDLSSLSLPDTAVGVVPLFTLKNLGAFADSITVNFEPFRFSYNLSFLQYQAQQNEKLQSTLDNVQTAINDVTEYEPTPELPSDSGIVEDAHDKEQELIDKTEEGRDEYNNVINDGFQAIAEYQDGFVLLSTVITDFVSGTWLRSVLILSLSIGIFGLITNLAFSTAGNSKAGRSRGRNSKGE